MPIPIPLLGRTILQNAYDTGHWRAGHSLALLAETGYGDVAPNCTTASVYLRNFIAERFTWVDMLNDAQKAHDEGDWRIQSAGSPWNGKVMR